MTTTLYRPVGQAELDLIAESGHLRFPPRLPEQPIFYPVLTEEYATAIARDWNAKGPAGASCLPKRRRHFARPNRARGDREANPGQARIRRPSTDR